MDSTVPKRGKRKVKMGNVMSVKMDKTVVVAVQRLIRHSFYGRVVKRTSSLKAHDEKNECGLGDVVRVMETRPLSKTKRWRVVEIVDKAKQVLGEGQQDDSGVERSEGGR